MFLSQIDVSLSLPLSLKSINISVGKHLKKWKARAGDRSHKNRSISRPLADLGEQNPLMLNFLAMVIVLCHRMNHCSSFFRHFLY